MDDLIERLGVAWIKAADAYRERDAQRVSDLLLPLEADRPNIERYADLVATVTLGAYLVANNLCKNAGHPLGAATTDHRWVELLDDPAEEPAAHERVSVSIVLAACNGDFDAVPDQVNAWGGPNEAGVARLTTVMLDLLGMYVGTNEAGAA